MNCFPRRATCLLALMLTGLTQADELAPFAPSRLSRAGSVLTLPLSRPPSAVYLQSSPERLVVEWAGVRLNGSPPAAPSTPGVSSVRWRQPDLSHVVCEVALNYRVPPAGLRLGDGAVQLDLDYAWEDRYRLSPAVVWSRQEQASGGRYLLWNQLELDPGEGGGSLAVGLAKDRSDAREKITAQVQRFTALGGVNGGYFAGSGGPLGIVFRDGKLVSPHVGRRPPRTTLGVMKDGTVSFEQVVARQGQLASRSGSPWGDVQLALGGGPRLLRRGQVALTTQEEALGPGGNDITRNCARTAVAVTRSGRVVLVTASGYSDNHLQGCRLEELAEQLQARGCTEAMNLDGGASTTMAVGDTVVSRGPAAPAAEISVATTLLVRDSRPQPYPARISVACSERAMPADGGRANLSVEVLDSSGQPVADGTLVRLYASRLKFSKTKWVTKGGKVELQAVALGSVGDGVVRAECAGARDEAHIDLQAGAARRIYAAVAPVRGQFGRVLLTAQAVDARGCPVGRLSLRCAEADQVHTTGANGQCSFELMAPEGGYATLTCPGVEAVRVVIPAPAAPVSPTPRPGATPAVEGPLDSL